MKKFKYHKIYQKYSVSDLILVTLYSLKNKSKKLDFEELLKECLGLFPKKFSFKKHTEWPDSRKVDRPLRNLREKKFIYSNNGLFSLAKTGKTKAIKIINEFRQKKLNLK